MITSDKIKLVIWDLDDTVWKGTLAEQDEVKVFPEVKTIIQELSYRGIVNSVCSKNDYKTAREYLISNELWDWIVFPSIEFSSKGTRVAEIIKSMNLRAENVLYIDDNGLMINEVQYYNPEINTLARNCISDLLLNPAVQGKKDCELTRLKQYKQAENRYEASKSASSNLEFMRSINIRIQFVEYAEYLFERVYELIERTNQLNFTKNRMSREELQEMLKDTSVSCGCIQVLDDFCDNGIVGFYAIKDNKLIHFLFSCRILNMGIEQYVYTKINEPELVVVGKVAAQVKKGLPLCDYITLIDNNINRKADRLVYQSYVTENQKLKLYTLGACDLYRMISNLAMPNVELVFECNVYQGINRSVNVGTEYIRKSFEMNDTQKEYCRKHFSNYRGDLAFNSKMLQGDYDYAIYAFHDDFTFWIYDHKEDKNISIIRNEEDLVLDDDNSIMSKEDTEKWLSANFEQPHLITPERFYENLMWIRRQLPIHTKMILINGPEYDYYIYYWEHNDVIRKQICSLNKVIKKFVQDPNNNAKLVDVNKYITDRSTFSDYIFHWNVEPSFQITLETLKVMASFENRKDNYKKNALPIQGKSLILIGNDKYSELANYALIANGYDISAKLSWEELSDLKDDQKAYIMQKENYVFLTDNDHCNEITDILQGYGYKELMDYIVFQQSEYIVHWFEKV